MTPQVFSLDSSQSRISACECPFTSLCHPRFSHPLKSPKFYFARSTLFIPLSHPTIGQFGRSSVERNAVLHNKLRRKRRRRNKKRGQEVQGCKYETPCSPLKRRVGGRGKKRIKRSWGCDSFFFFSHCSGREFSDCYKQSAGTTPFSAIAPVSICLLCSECPFLIKTKCDVAVLSEPNSHSCVCVLTDMPVWCRKNMFLCLHKLPYIPQSANSKSN